MWLSPNDEYDLAMRWKENADEKARNDLVNSHLRFVIKIASGYRNYGIPVEDLVGEGSLGAMNATKKFDPEKGFRFATYAMWWIRAAITDHIIKQKSMVKMGTSGDEKKLFFALPKTINQMGIDNPGDPHQAQIIAENLGVQKESVIRMVARLGGDCALDSPVNGHDGDGASFHDFTPDTDAVNAEEMIDDRQTLSTYRGVYVRALDTLETRERDIFEKRNPLEGESQTLEEVGEGYGISRERVRQIEAKARIRVMLEIDRIIDEEDLPYDYVTPPDVLEKELFKKKKKRGPTPSSGAGCQFLEAHP